VGGFVTNRMVRSDFFDKGVLKYYLIMDKSINKKIILYISMSIDGFIAKKNGSVDFLDPYNESGDDCGYKEFYDSVGTIVMGNTTYKQFGGTKEFKQYYKGKPIFVFSRKNKDKNGNINFVSGDVKEFIEKLDIKDSKNIWLLGGASIANEFLKNDLIDEFIITIIPILLGDGISLFKSRLDEKKLKLVEVKNFNMGVVQVHYKKI